MIDVKVKAHEAGALKGTYDIYVYDGGNGELLLFSNQGYENEQDAERLAKRLFASLAVWSKTVGVSPDFQTPESVDLIVERLNGKNTAEPIR